MKKIKLNGKRGGFTIVDNDIYDIASKFKWSMDKSGYVRGWKDGKCIRIHELVLQKKDGLETDHISGDKLDNRRSNIRLCTHQQNMSNRKAPRNKKTSKYKGVFKSPGCNSSRAAITYKGKKIYLGSFRCETVAALAVDRKAKEILGEYARLNFP